MLEGAHTKNETEFKGQVKPSESSTKVCMPIDSSKRETPDFMSACHSRENIVCRDQSIAPRATLAGGPSELRQTNR